MLCNRDNDNKIDNNNDNIIGKEIKVYIEPALDYNFVISALKLIPNFWKFSVREWDPDKVKELSGSWDNFLIPLEDDAIVIFAANQVNYGGGAHGDGEGPEDDGAGIAIFQGDTEFSLGLRIWHELLHTEGLPADSMMYNTGFLKWLPRNWEIMFRDTTEHDIYWQLVYYTFLMEVANAR